MTLVIGVDPGLSGAIAAVEPKTEHLAWVIDMPIAGNTIATPLLADIHNVDAYGPWDVRRSDPVAIERVHSMPKQGVASTFTFGQAYGTLIGWFSARGHRIEHVTPVEWKRGFRLTAKDKDAARLLAIELWPDMADQFKRKADIGRADAALIALHHARTINQRRGVAA